MQQIEETNKIIILNYKFLISSVPLYGITGSQGCKLQVASF